MRTTTWRGLVTGTLTLALASAAACGDDPTGPEVIEEVEFAASLGIDLSQMTRLPSGTYIEDVEVGTGDPSVAGQSLTVEFTGWLRDGTVFDSGTFSFVVGIGQAIPGFDEGVLGMRLGGVRKIVIPPAQGYGSQARGSIPPNSILVFRVEVTAIG